MRTTLTPNTTRRSVRPLAASGSPPIAARNPAGATSRVEQLNLSEAASLQLLDLLRVRMDHRGAYRWSRNGHDSVARVLLARRFLQALHLGGASTQTQAEDS